MQENAMKADELKSILKDYSKEELIRLYSKTYRMVPKEKREDELDQMIRDRTSKPAPKKKEEDFESVMGEVLYFESAANQQLYLRRNRQIPEKKRRNRRFDIKKCIKYLSQVPAGSVYFSQSADLLLRIFAVLSKGCGIWLFSTDQPFQSVGTGQPELFGMICSMAVKETDHTTILKKLITLACSCYLDYTTLHEDLIAVLLNVFNTEELRNEVIDMTKLVMQEENSRFNARPKKSRDFNAEYYHQEAINYCTILVLAAMCLLGQEEEGCRFYWKNHKENSEEINLYVLLRTLKDYELYDLWLKEYKAALKRKVKVRDSLKEEYRRFSSGQFTDEDE